MRFWFSRQGQADDVNVVLLDRPHHRGAPPAADVDQRHARLEAQLAERQVDLGHLRFFERHVVALEVSAAVDLVRVLPQLEELVGDVVVELHFPVFDPRVRAADSDNHLERARGTDVGISFDVFGTVILVAVGTKAIEAQVFPERTPCRSLADRRGLWLRCISDSLMSRVSVAPSLPGEASGR